MSANKQKHHPLLYIDQPEVKLPPIVMQNRYSIKTDEEKSAAQPEEETAVQPEEKEPAASAPSEVQLPKLEESATDTNEEEPVYETFSTNKKATTFRRVKHFRELSIDEKLEYLANIPNQIAPVSCLFITSEGRHTGSLLHCLEHHIEISPPSGTIISIEKHKLLEIQMLGFR